MSLMNIGVSALKANQQALNTTGHNIANVNTPGYSRQTLHTQTSISQNRGSGFIGTGTSVSTVTRNYSALLNRQSNAATAMAAADSSRLQQLQQMQDVFSGGDGGLGAAISAAMNALIDVQAAPTDATGRNVVLTRMAELGARFQAASNTLQEQDYLMQEQLGNNVRQINQLAEQVAVLNGQISMAMYSGHAPNDLLDARDQIIREINQYIQTSQVTTENGQVSLMVGGGHTLVLGTSSAQLQLSDNNEYMGSGKMALYFGFDGQKTVELTPSMMGGGEVAGLLKFKNEDLTEGRNLLGRLALAIGHELNQQNQLGLTLNGVPGIDLFDIGEFEFNNQTILDFGYTNIKGYSKNNVDMAATVSIVDATKFKPSDYKIIFDTPNPKIERLSDGATTEIDLSTSASGEIDITIDGLQFFIPSDTVNAAKNKQSILFQPFSNAAGKIQSLIHNPDELAAASALTANIDKDNQGTLQMTQLKLNVTGGSVPVIGEPVKLRFNADGTISQANYDPNLNGPGQGGYDWSNSTLLEDTSVVPPVEMKYTPGIPISVGDWSITLTGTPHDGDMVMVGNALDLGEGFKLNTGNISEFMGLRDKALFDNGTTFSDGFAGAMAVVGTKVQSAKLAANLSETVANNLEMERQSVAGVNLDEEAARLLQYQQAYQASSKVIQISQSLFDSVLSAVGR
ncbi:MAG: flagellar hook-associated protein FlgK [Comamonas sp.]|nr:flagellar hook-associated protein FlgK [Comamonas sp.]